MRILTATATTTTTTTNHPPRSPRYTATGVEGQRGKQSEYLLGVLLALFRAEGEPESLGYSSKVVLSMHGARQRCGRYLASLPKRVRCGRCGRPVVATFEGEVPALCARQGAPSTRQWEEAYQQP